MTQATAITPVLRYRDINAAARWLCEAFGFQELDRAQELDGNIRYVSLRLGDSILLLRPVANSLLDDFMVQPEAVGGASTQICYVTVPDVSDHHARSEKAGAKVGLKPQDDGLGGRFYTCRDLEDHLWCFGTHTYMSAHGAASAFEPVLLGPPPASAPDSPQRRTSGPAKRARLRGLVIAAAIALLAAAGWAYHDISVRSALREAAATSGATAARLKDATEQLAHERGLRLAAEAASKDAASKLAAERTVAAQLRQAVAGASAEKDEAVWQLEAANKLNKKHRLERERAEAKVAAAKAQIAEAEAKLAQLTSKEALERKRLEKEQQANLKGKEELQEAKTALLVANKKIEELSAGQLVHMLPDDGEPVAETSACALAVQGKIPSKHKGPATWTAASLSRLCRGAEASVEPGKCFEEVMRGRVSWGAGRIWESSNALALCGGTESARRTLGCFRQQIASGRTWQVAIRQCTVK